MTRVVQTANAVKKPCQQRSRDSLERILKSAEALIRAKGYEALTIAEVVRRSHTSTGTLYARFPDKTALLYAIHERVLDRDGDELQARLAEVDWDGLGFEETVRKLVAIKCEVAKGTEKLYEAFVVSGATDRVVRQRGYRSKAFEEDLEVQILLKHADVIGPERAERAARIASRLWQAAREEKRAALQVGSGRARRRVSGCPHERDGRRRDRLPAGTGGERCTGLLARRPFDLTGRISLHRPWPRPRLGW